MLSQYFRLWHSTITQTQLDLNDVLALWCTFMEHSQHDFHISAHLDCFLHVWWSCEGFHCDDCNLVSGSICKVTIHQLQSLYSRKLGMLFMQSRMSCVAFKWSCFCYIVSLVDTDLAGPVHGLRMHWTGGYPHLIGKFLNSNVTLLHDWRPNLINEPVISAHWGPITVWFAAVHECATIFEAVVRFLILCHNTLVLQCSIILNVSFGTVTYLDFFQFFLFSLSTDFS